MPGLLLVTAFVQRIAGRAVRRMQISCGTDTETRPGAANPLHPALR